jgi:hypothetical protein
MITIVMYCNISQKMMITGTYILIPGTVHTWYRYN